MTSYRGDRLDLDLEGVHRLDVRIVAGEVNVSASSTVASGSARVEIDVVRGPDVDVVLDDDGTLVVEHRPVRSLSGLLAGEIGAQARVTVVVSPATPTHVRTVSADAFVSGLGAGTSVVTVSGAITATGLDGEVTLRTVSGDLEVQDVGGIVRTNAVSGDLTISGGDPEEVTARAVSGDVTLDLDEEADIECVTVSGDVAVRLPADAGVDLDVVTVSGRLETSFPDGGLESGKRRLRGRIGDGACRVTVRTTSGDAVLLRRATAEADADADADAEGVAR
jgi:hypothetical protein